MPSTLSLPVQIVVTAEIHEIAGGGFWAEVPSFPGCVAQAETREAIPGNIARAIEDWLSTSAEKTVAEAGQLAAIQGGEVPPVECCAQSYEYCPPPSWSDHDE